MQAIVLVGGFGTRLHPLTRDVPKQMLPVVDRPMIEHVVAHLAGHGVTRVVLSLGFHPEAFADAYPDGTCAGIPLHYAVEPEPLDTAGAVRFAAAEAGLGDGDDAFLVLNGDVLTDLDVGDVVARHRAVGAEGTLALTEVDDPSRYGVVPTDRDGRVLGFVEKPEAATAPTRWINAGTYVLEPTVLARIPDDRPVSIEREVFPAMAVEGRLHAVASEAYWIDTGTPEAYIRAQLDLVDGTRGDLVAVHPEATVHPDARIDRSVVMAGAAVGEGARLCDAVVMEGGSVGAGATVDHSVVGPRARVGSGASLSALTVVGEGQVVSDDRCLSGARIPEDA